MRILATLFCIAPALAQSSLSLIPAVNGPSPRADAPLVHDPAGNQLLIFGGQDATSDQNDVWAYSLATREWQRRDPAGAKPAPRHGHTVNYDAARRRLIVFAGQASGFFNDVWAYDIAGNTWQQLDRGTGPTPRYAHSAVTDPTGGRLIISHGFTSERGRFDDTWEFNLTMNRWLELTPSGAKPLRRCLHHAVLDEAAQEMLLFGGCASGAGPCPLDDLWAFNLQTNRWTQKSPTARPRARERYGMTFDSTRRKVVIYAGSGGGKLGDLWEYDATVNAWSQVLPAGPSPARSRHEGIYVPALAASVFFGGDIGALSNDLIFYTQGSRPAIAQGGVRNAFSGAAGPGSPGEARSVYGTAIGPETGVAASYDSNGQLPMQLGDVTVTVNGLRAPLYFVRADQINFQIPYELAGQTQARVVVTYKGIASAEESLALAPTAPGLLGTIFDARFGINSRANPAGAGDIVVLYATGQGVTAPASITGKSSTAPYPNPVGRVTLKIGGREADLLFTGQAPGTTGLMQINARVPAGVAGQSAPVVLTVGGVESPPVSLAVLN
ncbi:MAG: hypothetical protein FJW40_10065 [Acidobacteria bacterium]|nr:hypothetical protein [Acidobacteriota bacterium]